jgi:predicted DNA-binding transcriptional regulator AlpA
MAAEVLTNWPTAFSLLLKAISDSSNNKSNGKLTTTFGGLYTALYKGFKDAEFEFLRTAFENYLTEHWTGALGKRNRRLNDRLLNSVAWIPANHACQLLSVSRRRLLDLIQEGRLRGEMRLSSKNRQFIVVMRVDVEGLVSTLDDGISLMEAASALGLTKQRLLNLLPIIYPGAKKLGVQGCPWSIPRTWIAQWEHLICSQRSIEHADSTQVELKYLLRYWPWTNAQVGKLINDIFSGTICPIGTLESNQGISALIFDKTQLNKWFIYQSAVPCEELTLPEAAVRMGVKQEVIYSLVRSALLQTTLRRTGRRAEQRVKFTQLEAFENQYVFGRDIAKTFGCSPRKVAALLEQSNVKPVAGPRNNNCRQLVFIRAEIDDWLSHKALTP